MAVVYQCSINWVFVSCHAHEPAGNRMMECGIYLSHSCNSLSVCLRLSTSPVICHANSCAGYPLDLSLRSLEGVCSAAARLCIGAGKDGCGPTSPEKSSEQIVSY
eukprot:1158021-Pelagomonas_calceolata.AAC.1